MPATLRFLGGAGQVTGSCALIQTDEVRFLVDCGLFQGGREAETRNRRRFEFDPRSLDFVLLTHAHIDHSGLLPRLAAAGFGGPVHTTAATVDLAAVMLRDAAYIQQKEAEWAAKSSGRSRRARAASWRARRDGQATHGAHGSGSTPAEDERIRHAGAPPLYTMADAEAVIEQFERHPYDQPFRPHPAVEVTLRDAGHILGSASVDIQLGSGTRTHRLVFSGDLGQPGHPVVRDAAPVDGADTLVIESTYGNRLHRSLADTLDELVDVLQRTLAHRRGNVVIPSFAVGRTQDLLVLLAQLARDGRLPPMDVYVDSPLAMAATRITLDHLALLDEQAIELSRWLRSEAHGLRIHFSESVEDSMAINAQRGGAVIISASGMCENGRVLHHLRNTIEDARNMILFVSFQGPETLGSRIVGGERYVRILGDEFTVRAEVRRIEAFSGHADHGDLLRWVEPHAATLRGVFLVHGEPRAQDALAEGLRGIGVREVFCPRRGDVHELSQ